VCGKGGEGKEKGISLRLEGGRNVLLVWLERARCYPQNRLRGPKEVGLYETDVGERRGDSSDWFSVKTCPFEIRAHRR